MTVKSLHWWKKNLNQILPFVFCSLEDEDGAFNRIGLSCGTCGCPGFWCQTPGIQDYPEPMAGGRKGHDCALHPSTMLGAGKHNITINLE